ncbi:ABC transporter G family member 28 [Cucurbita maxima]|uniref:ABC transporter G family member 28 n=1 Tax=Cucurbita maxima TaxID=3661 RepID=A0A6J1KFF4_CUCMA|nr:ABC transporter G family member 28 [Cucurbita maxima]
MRKEMKFEIIALFSISFLLLLLLRSVEAQEDSAAVDQEANSETDYEEGGDGVESDFEKATSNILADVVNDRIKNFTSVFKDDIQENFGFCIADADADWDGAFNFTNNSAFISNCAKKSKDILSRICTAAEVKFYLDSYFGSRASSKRTNYLKPNKNCNLSSWVSGCEPGWACSAGMGTKVDYKETKVMPTRTIRCRTCCEGFFCPHGITCMIPCPLGAYCPLAKLNASTGICEPYHYQLPPGKINHTCGGADVWADIMSSNEVFCSAGSYCPSTILKNPCSSGYYCRTGSTSQQRCFQMATCTPKSANQNITAYGVMLFAGISFLLIIFYNCSDQVLSTRERRQAKSREKAVQSVRETAQAREKWKSAKDIAKKHAVELQTQFSRTFSRRKSTKHPELKGFGQPKPGTDAALGAMPPMGGSSSSGTSKGKKNNNLTKMLHEIETDPDNQEGFNLEIGDKNIKKHAPKGKQLHTQSQIFKYAYGQIEKEKALQEQNKNLTFSGVISMANDIDIEIRKRPMIEVAFKDLTITLKGKNRHLMRCVTGKIMPGKVSAVMGPSGAGKTTFLSALAGKVTGCTMTGMILINGQPESIHSYKKIIGFVPQDDIVHGNLTVEENLWFSARCRLSADLLKPEKVLVVERVIESLGLQAVRDSLVGTVEKRGISGGQRKRVNVGLEMVMEPSLLILDEPTSGLDSSSSQLLLKALRREALEGVNICMVVHQPSYTLFTMFDELILLAKGGLTVYHGPVKKLEEYFATLGIKVPDRVNPPDYFIDILEGMVKLNTSTGITYKQLPVRWMLHNGYPVPMDMLQSIEGMSTSAAGENSSRGGTDSPDSGNSVSFVGEFLQDVKHIVERKKDHIQLNFLKSSDLSNRKTPSVSQQYKYFLGRLGKQRLREARTQAVDYLILLLAGICLGTLAKVSDESFGSLGYTYTVIAVSLLCKITALRSFSLDKLHYWRESSSGMSSLAYFLAKDTIDLFNAVIKPMVYLSMFYFFNNPRSSITDNYIVLFCLVYCVTGIAYALAIFLEPGPAQLWSVLLPVVMMLVATHNDNNEVVDSIGDLCYTKWALEAFVIANAKRYSGVWLITRCGSLMQSNYDLKNWYKCLICLIVSGVISRVSAFFCMVTFQKK